MRAEKHFKEQKDSSLPLPIWYQDGLTKQWKSGKLILQGKGYACISPDGSNELTWLPLQKIRPKGAPAGSQHGELRPWQRSWGRRLGIHKGGIEPQEYPWKFSSIYPQNQSLPTFCFVLSPTPLTLPGAVPHYLSLKKELTYSSS